MLAFGEAYLTTLTVLTKSNPDHLPGVEQIRDESLRQLKSFQKKPPKLEAGEPASEPR